MKSVEAGRIRNRQRKGTRVQRRHGISIAVAQARPTATVTETVTATERTVGERFAEALERLAGKSLDVNLRSSLAHGPTKQELVRGALENTQCAMHCVPRRTMPIGVPDKCRVFESLLGLLDAVVKK